MTVVEIRDKNTGHRHIFFSENVICIEVEDPLNPEGSKIKVICSDGREIVFERAKIDEIRYC